MNSTGLPGGSVNEIEDSELVRRVISGVAGRRAKRGGKPLWYAVGQSFCLGSTYSQQLCRRFGYDPNLLVRA